MKVSLTTYSKVYVPKYHNFIDITTRHEKVHWTEHDAKLGADVTQWKNGKITDEEKALVSNILRLFTQSDVNVGQAYFDKLIPVIKNNEARNMMGSFAARECFDDETELLTSNGWKYVDEISMVDEVAQYNLNSKEISFCNPDKVQSYDYEGPMHHYDGKSLNLFITPEHRLLLVNPHTKKMKVRPSEQGVWGKNFLTPVSGVATSKEATKEEVGLARFLVAAQADGSFKGLSPWCQKNRPNERRCYFSVKKDRKVKRFLELIKEYEDVLDLDFIQPYKDARGFWKFSIIFPEYIDQSTVKSFDCFDLKSISQDLVDVFIDELRFWDGTIQESSSDNSFVYYNSNRLAIDKVSMIATMGGYRTVTNLVRTAEENNGKDSYSVSFVHQDYSCYPHRKEVLFSGKVYCVSMPETTLVVRRHGKVCITGNSIHQRAYALLSDTLGFGEDFYWEFMDYHEMKEKHEFMVEQIGKSYHDFAVYLAKQTMIEGVNLFASFAVLLNFDRLGKLPGMCDIVRWSMIDESIHIEGNCALFREFLDEHPSIVNDEFKKEIYETARTLVKLEDSFIDRVFKLGGVSNLDKEDVKKYVRYVTDYRLNQLGFKKNWHVKDNPLDWIDSMMGKTFSNFFEREVVEYSKNNLTGDLVKHMRHMERN